MLLESKIEAILFVKAQPVSIAFFTKTLKQTKKEVEDALVRLEDQLKTRGIRLIFKDDEVSLGTASELETLIKEVVKAELTEELGKAALETLTAVLYHGPISKSRIDFIRGVNSQFILRNLLVRGLVERVTNSKDKRVFFYRPTFDLLQHLGVTRITELPEYDIVKQEIEEFEETFQSE